MAVIAQCGRQSVNLILTARHQRDIGAGCGKNAPCLGPDSSAGPGYEYSFSLHLPFLTHCNLCRLQP